MDSILVALPLLLLAAATPVRRGGGAAPAELIVCGEVLTLDRERPRAECVAASGGRVAAVGSREEVLALRGPGTRVVEAPGGAAILPGLHDAHAHLLGLGLLLSQLDLVGTGSEEEVVGLAARSASAEPGGSWIVGRGWDQNDWPEPAFPDHRALSARTPDHPVYLVRIDGHAAWVNACAMAAAGIGSGTPDPEGGRIVRDPATGEPTGILVDEAMGLVRRRIPEPGVEERVEMMRRAQARCHEVGLTAVHDMGIDEATLEAYRRMDEAGELRLRIHALLGFDGMDLGPWLARSPERGEWLSVAGIKLYLDGALGSRGAALLESYSDDPGNTGLILSDVRDLLDVALRGFRNGWQVGIHAIGDRANRLGLDLIEDALDRTGVEASRVRPRIEHAQILAPEDVDRFASLGVIASMQPTHCTSDMDWVDERLGAGRLGGAYAWRAVLDSGARLAFGSDFPVERPHPLEGVYSAVTRQHSDGTPLEGFLPGQRLSVLEALEAFTSGAAWAAFEEERLGRLAPGLAADLVVLDRNPTQLRQMKELLETRILLTVAGGEVVFEAPPS